MKSIRLHKLLVEKYLLQNMILEAQNYEGMFTTFLDDVLEKDGGNVRREKQYQKRVKEEIDWARRTLKKNDRIVWFLRFLRYELYVEAFRSNSPGSNYQSALKDFNRSAKTDYNAQDMRMMPFNQIKTNLEHFMSLNIPEIQNYVFAKQKPAELFNTFSNIEKQAQSKMGDDAGAEEMFKQNRLIEQKENDDVIIRFPDGFAWLDLHTPADDEEGEAMGHCGNRASYREDETILSLRKPVKYQGKQWWYPVCTFILDGNGRLGEMKGRANEKPQDRYHPYIIALLKTPRIKAIKGGGYDPENNFSLNDLTDAEKDSLAELNPNLMDMLSLYKKHGVTDELKHKIIDWCEANDIGRRWSPQWIGDKLVIEEFKNIGEMIDDYGNEDAKHAYKYLSGDDHYEVYDATADKYQMREFIRSLKPEDLKLVGKYLQKNYPDDAADIEDYDPSNADDVVELFESTDDEDLQRVGDHAYMNGLITGAENEMSKSFHSAIDNNPYFVFVDSAGNPVEGSQWDTRCYSVIPIHDLMNAFKADNEENVGYEIYRNGWRESFEDMEIDLSQPHYGWSGYDEETGNERFAELIHEDLDLSDDDENQPKLI